MGELIPENPPMRLPFVVHGTKLRTKIDTDPPIDRLFFSTNDTSALVLKVKGVERFVVKEFPDAADQHYPLGKGKRSQSPGRLEVNWVGVPFVLLVAQNPLGKVDEGSQVLSNRLFQAI